MNIYEVAARGSTKLEKIFKSGFKAEGKGLNEYLNSVEEHVPVRLAKQIRYIATVRNNILHNEGKIENVVEYSETIERVASELMNIAPYPINPSKTNQSTADFGRAESISVLAQTNVVRPISARKNKPLFYSDSNCSSKAPTIENTGKKLATIMLSIWLLLFGGVGIIAVGPVLMDMIDTRLPQKTSSQVPPIELDEKTIRRVQERLDTLGYKPGAIDGVLGSNTITAIKAFEEIHELTVDGELTRFEYHKLISTTAKRWYKK